MNALINVVLPVFGIILTGYLAGRLEVLGRDSAAALNRFVFYFALPPAVFIAMARAPIDKIFNWPFIGAFVGGSVLTLLIALVVGRFWFRHDVATLTVAGIAAAFGNVFILGLPLLLTAYGPDGALPSIVAGLSITILFICGAIAVLESARATGPSALRVAVQSVGAIFRNPLLISLLLGILCAMIALPLPKAASNYLDLMAAAVAPAALFSLGLSLIDRKLTGNAAEVIWLTALKVIANPILTFALVTYVFVLDPLWSQAAIILSAMPIGANPYIIAQQYNVHVDTVSSAVVVSTGMSVVTVALLLIWLGVG
jgi:malonate transporter and related proteins